MEEWIFLHQIIESNLISLSLSSLYLSPCHLFPLCTIHSLICLLCAPSAIFFLSFVRSHFFPLVSYQLCNCHCWISLITDDLSLSLALSPHTLPLCQIRSIHDSFIGRTNSISAVSNGEVIKESECALSITVKINTLMPSSRPSVYFLFAGQGCIHHLPPLLWPPISYY